MEIQAKKEHLASFLIDHQNSLYRFAFCYVHNEENAMDLLQEAIVSAYSKLHTLKNDSFLKTWFYRILINECIDFLRKEKHARCYDNDFFHSLPDPKEEIGQLADSIDLYHAVNQLKPKLKTIIVLRYYEDMKIKEIAKIINCNENTVKTRLYKALNQLKDILERSN